MEPESNISRTYSMLSTGVLFSLKSVMVMDWIDVCLIIYM